MNKKAFTLIEMLISIAILVTVVGFFVFFIADTRTKIAIQSNTKEEIREQSAIKNLLYRDWETVSQSRYVATRFCSCQHHCF